MTSIAPQQQAPLKPADFAALGLPEHLASFPGPLGVDAPSAQAPVSQAPTSRVPPSGASQQAAAPDLAKMGLPAGLADSDWLSATIEKMWPWLSPAIEKMAWEMLPDLLAASKPPWMTSLHLKRFEVGSEAPKISNIRVGLGPAPGIDDIFIDADIKLHSRTLDVELAINPLPKFVGHLPGLKQLTTMTVGVEDFDFEGEIRLVLTPLLKEMPVVGAIQISLLSMPWYDMQLTLGEGVQTGASGLLLVVEPWLKAFLEDSIFNSFILPGHYFLPLKEGTPDVQTAVAVLQCRVVEAEEVPQMDYFTSSSPYCKVWLTGCLQLAKSTEIVDYNKNPKWNAATSTFGFPVHVPDKQSLVVALFDSDVAGDDEIGRLHLPLSKLTPGKQMEDIWLDFTTEEKRASKDRQKREQHDQEEDSDAAPRGSGDQAKPSMASRLLKTVMRPGQTTTKLHKCRVRVEVTQVPLSEGGVEALQVAEQTQDSADHLSKALKIIEQGDADAAAIIRRHNLLPVMLALTTGGSTQEAKQERAQADVATAQS